MPIPRGTTGVLCRHREGKLRDLACKPQRICRFIGARIVAFADVRREYPAKSRVTYLYDASIRHALDDMSAHEVYRAVSRISGVSDEVFETADRMEQTYVASWYREKRCWLIQKDDCVRFSLRLKNAARPSPPTASRKRRFWFPWQFSNSA